MIPLLWSSLTATEANKSVFTALIVGCAVVAFFVWLWRQAAREDARQSELAELNRRACEYVSSPLFWEGDGTSYPTDADLLRAIDDGTYRIPEHKVVDVMHAIYPESPRWKKSSKEIA